MLSAVTDTGVTPQQNTPASKQRISIRENGFFIRHIPFVKDLTKKKVTHPKEKCKEELWREAAKWARKKKIVTDLGAFLDPLADKMLVNLAFLVLVYLNVVPLWVFAIILVRDFAVDGMRMMAARDGVTIAASYYGKLKTTVQMIALIILILNLIVNLEVFTILGNIALYLALILTIFSGVDYLAKGYKLVIKKSKK